MRVFWHRRDLRIADNRGLAAAAADDTVLPAFVVDDGVLEHAGATRVRFMLDALASLRATYRGLGSDLLVVRGDPTEELPRLASHHDADGVYWNEDYSGLARERDAAVRRSLEDDGLVARAFHDAVHHEPGTITTNEGEPYSVYSYFWKKWRDRSKADPYPAPGPESLVPADDLPADPLPDLDDLGFAEPDAVLQRVGTDAAHDRLDAFLDGPIYEYQEAREYPAREGTSRLSADLKWGTIGVREVSEAVEAAAADAPDDGAAESVEEFRSQLAWREFYAQVLWANPNVVSENVRTYERPIEWREDPEALRAWKVGETGFPIVDAGMRQLREEAYMHNRVRMIVASFLTKDLRVDWREGYAHFRELLVDHDAANDSCGWQWAASTGTDAQPYFRVFNPTTQGERYDPDAEYIREYVPAFEGIPAEEVHGWPDLTDEQRERTADHPHPIVDHAEAREAAIGMFERARGDDGSGG
ncbi:deoxyribodipyrimidine photo-lyase [Halorarum halophilum]|uniref:Deoxyribodipyrimidine photo-lyase n=1 Tax=Halorarum halophilum TaxID=2743090 RepID=A0A7D5KEM9_9EURY|nr:deoxyribodipyrimidine photo-lyase [Halobaculum halophilum]QLG26936.1 deoxyribodipyrimidine photo-lyase [Halobaculum halophilum]